MITLIDATLSTQCIASDIDHSVAKSCTLTVTELREEITI